MTTANRLYCALMLVVVLLTTAVAGSAQQTEDRAVPRLNQTRMQNSIVS